MRKDKAASKLSDEANAIASNSISALGSVTRRPFRQNFTCMPVNNMLVLWFSNHYSYAPLQPADCKFLLPVRSAPSFQMRIQASSHVPDEITLVTSMRQDPE